MESKQTVDTILESLEEGLKTMMESSKFKEFLDTMSKFHNYSFNNTLLIAMQRPDASLVAGYNAWQKNFGRQVNKGEKGIKILAPAPYKKLLERDKIDPDTKKPVVSADGRTQKEVVEVTIPAFKPVTVFDVAQTSGKEIPTLGVEELDGSVSGYTDFKKALENVSPVPITEKEIGSGAKGYFSPSEQIIALQKGMSEIQSIKTMIHEIAHAFLHDKDGPKIEGLESDEHKGRSNKEVEAESVAYTVCKHFGIDTSEYSFGYVAGWSSGKELTELRESMDTIKKTASTLITDIEEQLQQLSKEKEKDVEIEVLAKDLDEFSKDFDPYGYQDNHDGNTDPVEQLVSELKEPDKCNGIIKYLEEIISENAVPETTIKAEGLLGRINELNDTRLEEKSKELPREASVTASPSEDSRPENYLKNAEMATEQNMNMIDQSINNVAPEDSDSGKGAVKPKKESIKEQMVRLKGRVDAECSHRPKQPVRGKEIETDGK